MSMKKKLVVPIVFDLFDYFKDKPNLSWVFQMYANYCVNNGMAIIAQEDYFEQDIFPLDEFYKDIIEDEEKKRILDEEKNTFVKYSISNDETLDINDGKKVSFEDQVYFMSHVNEEYISIINSKLDKIEKDYGRKVDAILTWYWNPSLEKISKDRNIKIIQQEISPIRNLIYRRNYKITLSYFQFENKFSKKYCENLYKEFLAFAERNELKIFSREELLQMFLSSEDWSLINEFSKLPQYELGISPPFKDDFFFEIYSNEKLDKTFKKVDELFKPEEVSIRCHPGLERSLGNPSWSIDRSNKAIYWVAQCKRVLTSVSNIAFDAMMLGKTVYLLSDNMPFSFMSFNSLNKSNIKKELVADPLYLNFIIFGYFVPWDLMLNQEYINWRMTNPKIFEIYRRNQEYILNKIHVPEHTSKQDKKEQVVNIGKFINEEEEGVSVSQRLLVSKNLEADNLKKVVEREQLNVFSLQQNVGSLEMEVNRLLKRRTLGFYVKGIYLFLFPEGSVQGRFLMFSRLVVYRLVKSLYNIYPVKKHKRTLIRLAYTSKKFQFLVRMLFGKNKVFTYTNSSSALILEDDKIIPIAPLLTINKSIAVHLHLFYEDLSEEFFEYLKNIPYIFDLYISVGENGNTRRVKRKFQKLTNVNFVEVKKSKNRGRDYGPMFALFGKKLRKYDYILHIHSKKSLRVGYEQKEWRKYMLDSLLGSKENVMFTFSLMEEKNVGEVFPDTYKDIPLWAHTWLGAMGPAKNLYEPMGMNVLDKCLDFSAGSMFWVKSDAIKQLFNLSWSDFEVEGGENDGTLAYALERGLTEFVKHNGYSFCTFDNCGNVFKLNKADKGLKEYSSRTKDSVINELLNFDIVSFDIFDTLVTRFVYSPDDVFTLVQEKINKENTTKIDNFLKKRKLSEENVRKRKKYSGDCSIDEIYDEFASVAKIGKEESERIKDLEFKTELQLIIPRYDVLDMYKKLIREGKEIILVSDTYLTKSQMEKILNRCGYYGYSDLFVSSAVGLRKDDGTMYDFIYKKYKKKRIIHVGDNESSDIHRLVKAGRACSYLAKGGRLLEASNYNLNLKNTLNVNDSVMLGLVTNKSMFNSPFALNNYTRTGVIKDLFSYGYSILGPIFLYFFVWLTKNIDENEILLFSAREAFYLQKYFNIFRSKLSDQKLQSVKDFYFITSRRSLSVPNIHKFSDVKKILSTQYNYGTLLELFYYRFGIIIAEEDDGIVSLPKDEKTVIKLAKKYYEEILDVAQNERLSYLKYIKSLIPNLDDKKISIVDLGYSGTCQYELSKLLNKKINGYYFCVSKNQKPLSLGCDVYSCFNHGASSKKLELNILYKYSLILESFLKAPIGQFVKFRMEGDTIKPEFLPLTEKDYKNAEKLDNIFEGVLSFMNDTINILGDDVFKMDITKDYVLRIFECFAYDVKSNRLLQEIKETLFIDDKYCGNSELNVQELLNKLY